MASIKVKFRPSTVQGREGVLYCQVIHNRMVRQLNTGCRVFSGEWDGHWQRVVAPPGTAEGRRLHLQAVAARLQVELKRIGGIIDRLEREARPYTVADVAAVYAGGGGGCSLSAFMLAVVRQLSLLGRERTAEAYVATLNSFMRFRNGADVGLGDVDSDMMMAYEAWLRSGGVCPNSSSFYMRVLRAVYNRAVERGLTVQASPFRHVYTGVGKTVKRALPLDAVRRIRDLDLSGMARLEQARDLFMFSFYTRGMSFVDMAYLRKRDLKGGVLSYRRRKTGQLLTVGWERCMADIVGRNEGADPYMLPIITRPGADARRQYVVAMTRVNKALKAVGRMAGLSVPLTMYCARHAWASIARSKHVPIAVISEGMGHDSEETTRIYLASLDAGVVDKANRMILRSL